MSELQKEVMTAGEPFEVVFEILLDDDVEDITAYTAKIDLRQDSTQGRMIASWTDASAELTRIDAAGQVTLSLLPAFTNAQNFKIAYLDLLLLKADGGRRSSAICITLDRGVTR